jgi:hypothetical protein
MGIKLAIGGISGGGGGGSTTFLGLTDTPVSFVTSNAIYKVNSSGDALVESAATISDAGTINLPSGQSYNVGGEDVRETLIIPVRNESGSTIPAGSVVYPTGSSSGLPTIDLADASDFDKCRLIGVTQAEIANNSNGVVVKFGSATMNTSGFSAGDIVYLSDSTPGGLTAKQPDGGSFITQVGIILTSDASGVVKVDTDTSELAVEVTDTNGFPTSQRTGTNLSFVDGTRTFSIAPTGSMFHYYQNGIKYQKTTTQSVVITDVEGLHAIYFDGDTLTSLANPNAGQIDTVIRTKAIVAYVYWDAANSESLYLADERHGISMSPETHAYLHFTRGAQYLQGLALNTLDVDGSGDDETAAQFGVDSGFITDEDLITSTSSIGSTTGLPIYYLEGATGNLRKTTETGFSVLTDVTAGVGVTGRLVYNEFTGTTWQLSTVSNNDFVLCHIFAFNEDDGSKAVFAVVGQNEYGSAGLARTGAETEISTILTNFLIEELVPVATVIFQTSDGYSEVTNPSKSRIRSDGDGNDYTDWRTTPLAKGASPSSHNNLANLEIAGSGVTYGHLNDQAQTIAGEKTFSTFPITPSASPDADYEVANKKYVDDFTPAHNDTTDKQGGTTDQYYHLTSAQHTIATQAASDSVSGYVNTTTQTFAGTKTFTQPVFNQTSGMSVKLIGSGTGNSNICFIPFFASDGTTRQGYIGVATGSNSDFYVNSDVGNLQLLGASIKAPSVYSVTSGTSSQVGIFSDGQLYRVTSSIVYKTNIEDLWDSWVDQFIAVARPIWYDSLSVADPTDWHYLGFIAEELAEAGLHQLVIYRRDSEGNLVPEGVQYDRITVVLAKVAQRQKKKIELIESKIESIEDQLLMLQELHL